MSTFAQENRFPVDEALPRLSTLRVTIPRPVQGYFHRPRLLERCRPLNRRVLVMQAPCGFGKTALLNDVCRREQDRGALVAWLRLEENLTGDLLLNSLAYAFARGGLNLFGLRKLWADERRSRQSSYRIGLLLRAIENYGKPCVIAFDQVERLDTVGAVATVNFLLQWAPRNLGFAMAMRCSPRGLDLATPLLDSRGTILTVEDLRFSDPEIALFLGSPLSREELVDAVQRTEGWPVALRMHRSSQADGEGSGTGGDRNGHERIVADFLGARLMRGLGDEARRFLLDIALFDAVEPVLVNEVLPGDHSRSMAEVLSELRVLVQRVDSTGSLLRLHPVVRDYCRARCQREDPGRFRMLQRRLAKALARRGKLNNALRHAAEVVDDALSAEILEDAQGVGLLPGSGIGPLLSASQLLNDRVVAEYPRLALMRCVALGLRGDLRGALALYELVGKRTRNFERDRRGGDNLALRADGTIVQSLLLSFNCPAVGDARLKALIARVTGLAEDGRIAPTLRGNLYTILCVFDHQRARFELSRRWGIRAKQCFALGASAHGEELIDLHRTIVAMVQGRVGDAVDGYSGKEGALVVDILLGELQIERNKELMSVCSRATENLARQRSLGTWFDVHAAAHGNAIESAFESGGAESALAVIEDSLRYANSRNLPALVRLLAAQKVSHLVAVGRVEEAQRAWREAKLPDRSEDQLDLDAQSWRELEAIGCARIRLLGALGEVDAARALAEDFRDVAQARALTRPLMRCLVEWMGLEYRALNLEVAAERLLAFLEKFRTVDYSRALARDRRVSVRVLKVLLNRELEPRVRARVKLLLEQLDESETGAKPEAPLYTAREVKVLEGLERGQRDKEIARHVGLTENGVRYHLKNIYRKMGASGRVEAVRHARSKGIV